MCVLFSNRFGIIITKHFLIGPRFRWPVWVRLAFVRFLSTQGQDVNHRKGIIYLLVIALLKDTHDRFSLNFPD
jgi:hypothetical protein